MGTVDKVLERCHSFSVVPYFLLLAAVLPSVSLGSPGPGDFLMQLSFQFCQTPDVLQYSENPLNGRLSLSVSTM